MSRSFRTQKSQDYEGLDPNKFIEVHGQIWERDVYGVVGEIQRRWPTVVVQYLDPGVIDIGLFDAPFQICERLPNGELSVIQQVWQLDSRVIKMLEAADSWARGENALEKVVKAAEKAAAERKRQQDAENDLATEITYSVLKSPKDTYTVRDEFTGKKLKFRSTEPVEVTDAPDSDS